VAVIPITERSRRPSRPAISCAATSRSIFDRTGFQEDWNVVFPLNRLSELAAEGTIGSVAATHYSFMGATDPVQMAPYARELAGRLKSDAVDAVILPPV
jgi:D-proline reductase (dithiol) PrdB